MFRSRYLHKEITMANFILLLVVIDELLQSLLRLLGH
jgi:hypothetical protein